MSASRLDPICPLSWLCALFTRPAHPGLSPTPLPCVHSWLSHPTALALYSLLNEMIVLFKKWPGNIHILDWGMQFTFRYEW